MNQNTLPAWRRVPSSVWALGIVSLLMDFSSEMIHALLPIYLVGSLGASMTEVGVIEGVAEATAAIVKIFSGAISDWVGKRKLLTLIGYGLAALTKPMFPLAPNVSWITSARFLDRVGKGIRGAPRDALVADVTPASLHGAAFGLRQSLDTIGAFLGPAVAVLVMWLTLNNIHMVFWVATLPAILAVVVLFYGVEEPVKEKNVGGGLRFPLHKNELNRLGAPFWRVAGVATIFSLARFSEAFLILKAQAVGLPVIFAPLVLVFMNLIYASAAYPLGVISDRMGRWSLLALSLIVLICADGVLAHGSSLVWVFCGVLLWGFHMGMSQGLFAALVADVAPPSLRGTAFGVYNLFSGLALFLASFLAGRLWDQFGDWATFLMGGSFALIALIGLLMIPKIDQR